MTFNFAEAEDFIAGLALPRRPAVKFGLEASARPQLEDAKQQALVVGSDVISFSDAVDAKVKAAVSNSALLAQLMADQAMPDLVDPMKWFDIYFKTLSKIGWVTQERDTARYEIKGNGLEVHEAIEDVLKLFLGPVPGAVTLAMAALTGLKSMRKDSPLITLFEKQSQHAEVGRFHFTTVRRDPNLGLLVEVFAFSLKAKEKLTQILFFKLIKTRTSLERSLARLSLNEEAVTRLAPKVAARVAAFQDAFIDELPLPPPPG